MTGLPHDDACELDQPTVSPTTGRTYVRETCECRHRREKRSKELVEQPLYLSWLHGGLGGVPTP